MDLYDIFVSMINLYLYDIFVSLMISILYQTNTFILLSNKTLTHPYLSLLGVIGIYGLIVAVLILGSIEKPQGEINVMTWQAGFRFLASGMSVGFSGMGAGWAIGEIG